MLSKTAIPGLQKSLKEDGNIFFAIDPIDAHNWLDSVDYDDAHSVNVTESQHLADAYFKFVPDRQRLEVLEVGCGTGNLTVGLAASARVHSLVACDISRKMLAITQTRTKSFENTHLVCADLNERGVFSENYYDAAVGNSLLHHIFEYEAFLTSLKSVIKPSGVIIFSEPCQQGKSIVSFLCSTILELDSNSSEPVFTPHDVYMINALLEINRREAEVAHDRNLKRQWEDKHCFDTNRLRSLASDLGFSNFHAYNTGKVWDGFKEEVERHLLLVGVDRPLSKFAKIFENFQREYVDMCDEYVQTPHQFLVFTK